VYSVFVVIIFVDQFRFLTIGIRALFLANIEGKYFLFLQFFFREEKKRAATFQKFLVYFCAKFVETGCRSDFLSENTQVGKKIVRNRVWEVKI
jgi:hypothetical protein